MRYPKQQKAKTRGAILTAAARLFRESGYDGVGVDAIMAEAGLTPGGFYAHFPSKEALFAEAMTTALDPGKTILAAKNAASSTMDRLTMLIKSYLSRAHRDSVADGCPLPVLATDVARKSAVTREIYERQFLRFINQIEELLPNAQEESRERALAIVAQCVGGLMLSRTVNDPKLSDQILKSSRRAAIAISGEGRPADEWSKEQNE